MSEKCKAVALKPWPPVFLFLEIELRKKGYVDLVLP